MAILYSNLISLSLSLSCSPLNNGKCKGLHLWPHPSLWYLFPPSLPCCSFRCTHRRLPQISLFFGLLSPRSFDVACTSECSRLTCLPLTATIYITCFCLILNVFVRDSQGQAIGCRISWCRRTSRSCACGYRLGKSDLMVQSGKQAGFSWIMITAFKPLLTCAKSTRRTSRALAPISPRSDLAGTGTGFSP